MRRLLIFGFVIAALFSFGDTALAQDQAFQTAVLKKLDELDGKISSLENRLNDMDKRYEVRFTMLESKLDERFNALNIRIDAVNQRFDDKFNLLVGLLALVAAFLALPYAPKLLERFKAPRPNKEELQSLKEQIEQIKTQLAQLAQAIRPSS